MRDMAKKDKKEKKGKKEKVPKKSRKERKLERQKEKDSWIYYPDNSVNFIVAVLVVFCVLDVILAIYAISYSRRVDRENAARAELARSTIERSTQGSAWFLQKDGTIVYENAPGMPIASTEPAVPAVNTEAQETQATQEAQEPPAAGGAETPENP